MVAATTEDRREEVESDSVMMAAAAVPASADRRFPLIGRKGAPAERARSGCAPGAFTSFKDADGPLRGSLGGRPTAPPVSADRF